MRFPEYGETFIAEIPSRCGLRFYKVLMVALIMVGLLLVSFSGRAEAAQRRRRHSSRNRRAAASARARKQQMISSIQKQVASARRVLAASESQTTMSQANVDQAIAELKGIHDKIKNAHLDVHQARKTLRDIEAEIRAEQEPDSELGLAEATLASAKDEVHRAIHRVHPWTDDHKLKADPAPLSDLSKLSPDQIKRLDEDKRYRHAKDRMKEAGRKAEQIRQNLFESDPDWVAARQDYLDSKRRSRSGSQQAGTVGAASLSDRRDLRKARNVAASARTVIALGEAQLRQLGARNKTSRGSKTSKSKANSKRNEF